MRTKRTDDLGKNEHGEMSWADGQAAASLQTMYDRAMDQADRAVAWYVGSRRAQRRGAVRLRVGAIVLVAAAGITPVLAQMFPHTEAAATAGRLQIDPALATVFLGIAALLAVMDRFMGYSNAWMRFASAEMLIRGLMDRLRMDWETSRATCCGNEPSQEQIQASLAMLKAFVTELNGVIQQETSAWIGEFKGVLAQIDAAAQPKGDQGATKPDGN